jgi:hypothetical protein
MPSTDLPAGANYAYSGDGVRTNLGVYLVPVLSVAAGSLAGNAAFQAHRSAALTALSSIGAFLAVLTIAFLVPLLRAGNKATLDVGKCRRHSPALLGVAYAGLALFVVSAVTVALSTDARTAPAGAALAIIGTGLLAAASHWGSYHFRRIERALSAKQVSEA